VNAWARPNGGDVQAAAIQKATNVFITPDGFMGRFMDIVVNQVFPYVILGALFGTSAGGTSNAVQDRKRPLRPKR